MTATLAPTQPLLASDRCDRCGAQAFVRVTLPGGSDLLFCGHHFREHEPKLRPVALDILDETSKLEPSAPVPATD